MPNQVRGRSPNSSVAARREEWLWCTLFSVFALLLGAYLLAGYLDSKPFPLDMFFYFCANLVGVAYCLYKLKTNKKLN
jgi:peptidoglycan/LPS O-acetylase OafA/YrhL